MQKIEENPSCDIESYRVGPFVWTVDGNSVILTKDVLGNIISVNVYTYKNAEVAGEAAYNMAYRQARA